MSPWSHVASPVASTCAIRGPMSGQISAQTLSERAPRTQSRRMPTVGRYASLQKNVRSGPHSIHIAYRESSRIRAAVLRLCGQASGEPSGVVLQSNARMRRPISPPRPRKASAGNDACMPWSPSIAPAACAEVMSMGTSPVHARIGFGETGKQHLIRLPAP